MQSYGVIDKIIIETGVPSLFVEFTIQEAMQYIPKRI